MPIKVIKNLPAITKLAQENIFVMDTERAETQQIRPLHILLVNLMPTKEVTETQILRALSNSPLQVNLTLLHTASRKSKNVDEEYLDTFYRTFDEVKDECFDGLIITGAPVEHLPFEEVDYWEEFTQVIDWSKTHVFSTLHICWGAQAGLYYRYGVDKHQMVQKLSGIYPQDVLKEGHLLLRGFDDLYVSPHSRHTEILKEDIVNKTNLEILASGKEVGISILASRDLREVYSFGHLEYDRDTLAKEYFRDLDAGLDPHIPENYFKNDDIHELPCMRWSSSAALFFSNWVNYAVYQETPFEWKSVEDDVSHFGYL